MRSSGGLQRLSIRKFVIASDKIAEVKDAFRHRRHLVDVQPGFVQVEVFSPY
jgi:heme-degrading monooxygenase HmoA